MKNKVTTTQQYIEEIFKINKHIENDNQLSILMNISRQAISNYRNGQNMSPYVATKVAHMVDRHPFEVICATQYWQAQTEEEKKFWKNGFNAGLKMNFEESQERYNVIALRTKEDDE